MAKGQIVALFLLLFLAPQVAIGQESSTSPLTLDLSTGLYSEYMFRGVKLYDETSVQPALSLSYSSADFGSISLSGWMHISGEGDTERTQRFTEFDSTLSYEKEFGTLRLAVGNIFYTFFDGEEPFEDTAEFFAGVRFDSVFHPAFTFYQDYLHYDEQYYELSLDQALSSATLGDEFKFNPFVALGWGTNVDRLYEKDGLGHITIGVFSDVPVARLFVTPYVAYSIAKDPQADNEFWFGISLSASRLVGVPSTR